MKDIIELFDYLVKSGNLSGNWIIALLSMGGIGVFFFYIVKSITLLVSYLKPSSNNASKEELASMKVTMQDDNKYKLKLLSDVHEKLRDIDQNNTRSIELNIQLENELSNVNKLAEEITELQKDGNKVIEATQRDLSLLVIDSKSQYTEITNKIQVLQRDLASLQGTIIGLTTQRSRLK